MGITGWLENVLKSKNGEVNQMREGGRRGPCAGGGGVVSGATAADWDGRKVGASSALQREGEREGRREEEEEPLEEKKKV